MIFNPPPGAYIGGMHVLHDFNGDGRSELVIYDTGLPYELRGQSGINYFYNTGSVFDTIPEYSIQGDSIKGISVGKIWNSGDINGDGKTDFTIYYSDSTGGRYKYFTKFFLGNLSFDLTPSVTYYQDSVGFVPGFRIVKDMNGDGKDDFLMSTYDNTYPYYYGNSILWGSFPIDTIQDVGLNTQNSGIEYETGAGDINGDGKNDLFVRMYGGLGYPNVKIWLGGKQMPYKIDNVADKTWYGGEEGFGRQIAAVGDVNGDGVNDLCIQQISYVDGVSSACYPGTVYIIKGDTSAKGDTVTSVNDNKNILPKSYVLEEPYPNPFNPSTVISYQLSVNSKVTLKIYDVVGKEIAVLVNEEQIAGKHTIEFHAEKYKLSSGVYLAEMKAYKNNSLVFSHTRKLSLVK